MDSLTLFKLIMLSFSIIIQLHIYRIIFSLLYFFLTIIIFYINSSILKIIRLIIKIILLTLSTCVSSWEISVRSASYYSFFLSLCRLMVCICLHMTFTNKGKFAFHNNICENLYMADLYFWMNCKAISTWRYLKTDFENPLLLSVMPVFDWIAAIKLLLMLNMINFLILI